VRKLIKKKMKTGRKRGGGVGEERRIMRKMIKINHYQYLDT
jgi:hypothetical protein